MRKTLSNISVTLSNMQDIEEEDEKEKNKVKNEDEEDEENSEEKAEEDGEYSDDGDYNQVPIKLLILLEINSVIKYHA